MQSSQKDIAYLLADYVNNTNYESLPEDAIEVTKKDILDTLGTALAGSTAEGVQMAVDLALEWAGKKESTIIGFGNKVPSMMAAFVNGTMSHARDYDDIHNKGIVHAGVTVIPASLAMAERIGSVSGKDFITAVALGIDITCRLGMACGLSPGTSGWHNTSIFGIFGSTAACGKLLELDKEKMINAFGIAYSQCSGTVQCIEDKALVKRMQAGFPAKGAVISALLAEKGFTGSRDTFEGKRGLFKMYYKKYDRDAVTSELGKTFEITNMSFKPYPACRLNHAGIDAALLLAKKYDIKPEEIESIVIHHGENSFLCGVPKEGRLKPKTVVDAQFSLPYTVSRALLQRKVSLQDFTPQTVGDESVYQLAQKVKLHFIPELTSQKSCEPTIVDIHLTGNRMYSERVDTPTGDPQNPMGWPILKAKFKDCASFAVKPLSEARTEELTQLLTELEKAKDLNNIVKLLS